MNSILVEDEGRFKFSCLRCNYKHDDPKIFHLHAASHISQSFRCDKCFFETDRKVLFAIHQQEHSSKDKMKSEFIIPSVSHLKPSWKESTMGKVIQCQKCDFRTKSSGNFKLHNLIHQQQIFQCIFCDYKTSFKKLLDLHEETHTPSNFKNELSCDFCNYVTYRKCSLLRHLLAHNEHEFECSCCNCKTETECKLNEHQCRNIHSMKCQICGVQTSNKDKFTRHMNTHLVNCYSLKEDNSRKVQISTKRKKTSWTLEDKREIYWCFIFARHKIFGKAGIWKREKKMLKSRGVIDSKKVESIASVTLSSLVTHIRRKAANPNSKLCMEDLRKIEVDVDTYVKSHIEENYSTLSDMCLK